MSFSKKVKEELAKKHDAARHCKLAELAAIISLCGRVLQTRGKPEIEIVTEDEAVARKCLVLLKEIFLMDVENSDGKGNSSYRILISQKEQAERILKAVKAVYPNDIRMESEGFLVSGLVAQNTCCKRAFIRGAFLAAGSVAAPEKEYHFEVAFLKEEKAVQLRDIINSFPKMEAKIVIRKKYYVVYVKEGSQLADLLRIMGAHVSLMELENVRILKEMRNFVNRKVNCEAANIHKTVTAAVRQIDDIIYIKDNMGFDQLTEGLEEIAALRLEHPDASLKELGAMLAMPIGKSGVNHRLKKLSGIAMGLRELKEGKNDFKENDDSTAGGA